MTVTFRCPPGLETIIPQPISAVLGLPDWFKALPPKAFNATMGEETAAKATSPSSRFALAMPNSGCIASLRSGLSPDEFVTALGCKGDVHR